MSRYSDLITILTAGSPQTVAEDKVRADAADEKDRYPFIIIRRTKLFRRYGLDNTLLEVRETFHVECWHEWREEALELEGQVIDRLDASGNPPEDSDPDGIAPTMDVRCAVVIVSLWSDVDVEEAA